MNPIEKLLREQSEEFEKLGELYSVYSFGTMDLENKTDEAMSLFTTAQQQLIDVIIEWIESNKEVLEHSGATIIDYYTITDLLEEAKKNV